MAFVTGCTHIFDGSKLDVHLIQVLGGEHAERVLAGYEGGPGGYWPRVWAMRGFLHCYEPIARDTITRALGDNHWRVREMALKVIRRHGIEEYSASASTLIDDPVERVRLAAERVLAKDFPTSRWSDSNTR
jgi:hypothetical protein